MPELVLTPPKQINIVGFGDSHRECPGTRLRDTVLAFLQGDRKFDGRLPKFHGALNHFWLWMLTVHKTNHRQDITTKGKKEQEEKTKKKKINYKKK